MALSGKDDDGNKVVDMPVMVSSNRSRENESRLQCRSDVGMMIPESTSS